MDQSQYILELVLPSGIDHAVEVFLPHRGPEGNPLCPRDDPCVTFQSTYSGELEN